MILELLPVVRCSQVPPTYQTVLPWELIGGSVDKVMGSRQPALGLEEPGVCSFFGVVVENSGVLFNGNSVRCSFSINIVQIAMPR